MRVAIARVPFARRLHLTFTCVVLHTWATKHMAAWHALAPESTAHTRTPNLSLCHRCAATKVPHCGISSTLITAAPYALRAFLCWLLCLHTQLIKYSLSTSGGGIGTITVVYTTHFTARKKAQIESLHVACCCVCILRCIRIIIINVLAPAHADADFLPTPSRQRFVRVMCWAFVLSVARVEMRGLVK